MSKQKRSPKTRQGYRRRGAKGTDGRYSYELYVLIGYKDEAKTKRDRKYRTVRCTSDAEAQRELNKFALAIHTDNYIKPEAKTLGKFFDEWESTYAREALAYNTLKGYKDLWSKHVDPGTCLFFGSCSSGDLRKPLPKLCLFYSSSPIVHQKASKLFIVSISI